MVPLYPSPCLDLTFIRESKVERARIDKEGRKDEADSCFSPFVRPGSLHSLLSRKTAGTSPSGVQSTDGSSLARRKKKATSMQ